MLTSTTDRPRSSPLPSPRTPRGVTSPRTAVRSRRAPQPPRCSRPGSPASSPEPTCSAAVMRASTRQSTVTLAIADGDRFAQVTPLATVEGPARAVLHRGTRGAQPRRSACLASRRSPPATSPPSPARARASSTPARPRRGCAPWNATPCAAAAGTTTATRCRTPCWSRTTTWPCSPLAAATWARRCVTCAQAWPHHTLRGGGRPARPDRPGAQRRRRHDHARQLQPRRAARGRRAVARPRPGRGQWWRLARQRRRDRRNRGGHHLGRGAHPQRPRA